MINLTVVIDNDEALKKLKELQKVAKQSTSSVVSDAERMDSAFNSVKGSIAELAGAAALGGFVNKVIQVRGEVQQLEVAFETMLGSKAKADALMADVINLAAKTPFGLQDVSNATKMLLAYGSTAESVADEIKMIGNIASGLSIPLNDLIYLYGTTRTQGRMFTQDLRQFMGRGIPLAEELAKQFGVTKDEVGALVTAGKVGFPEMQKALQGMTSEGGQFFNLMEKQSQTIAGQISNLEDSIYQMFNAIGESQQGTISKGISMVSSLVENYEKVIDVISHLIIVYGSYKAAVMAVAAAQSVASMLKMVKTLYDVAKGAQTAAAAFSLLSGSTKGWVGLATGVISAIGILMMDFGQKTEKAAETMGELEQAARDEQLEVNKLVYQLKQANTSEEERTSILERLNRIAPSIVEGINDESSAFENLTSKLEDYNNEQVKRIQLASLADRQNQAINDYASADLAYKEYTKAVEARMAKLVAEYTSSGTLPDVKFNYNGENALPYAMREGYEAEIRKRIKEALEQASLGELNGVKLAEKLYDIAKGSGTDIVGYDEDFIGSKLSKFYWDREKKKKQLDSTTKNVEEMRSLLGVEGQDNTEDEQSDLNDTKQYLEAKQAAYEAWVEELKKLKAIERGAMQATADEYKKQKEKEANARKEYEALGGVTKGITPKSIDVGDDFLAEADKEAAKATEKLEAEIAKRAKTWDEYLIQFGTFRERWAATERKYDREISEAETEGERKALEAERDAALAAFAVQAGEWAKDLANKSQEEINRLLEELQAQVDAKQAAFDALDSSDTQDAKDYQKTINELKAKIAHLKTLVKDTGEEVKKDNWSGAALVLQKIADSAQSAASSIEEFDSGIAGILSTIADFASVSANLVGAIKIVVDAAGDALNTALGVIGLIAVAVQVVSTIISKVVAVNKEYKETIDNFKALNRELEQMNRLAKINSLDGTIFGEDAFGNFVNNLDVMRDAAKTYSESMDDVAKAEYNRRKAMLERQIAYASQTPDEPSANSEGGFEKSRKQVLDELFAALDELKASELAELSAYESLQQMEVRLSRRKRSTLAEQLPELFEGGEITLEGLQKLQQSDVWDKLSKENRTLIEQMISDWEYYNQSVEAVNDYLKSIFGDFGETMTDILVDSFNEGTDAALEFGDAMADIIDRLTKEFIYSAFIKDFVDDAQAQVDALNEEDISGEEKVKRLVGILKQLSNDVLGAQDEVNAALEQMEAEGVSVDRSSGQQSASSGGFQTMSQETGSELNGRFTDIQGKVTYINEAVQFMKSLSASQVQHTASISETVALIRNDTMRIEEHTRVLGQMAADIASIKSDISNGGY
jgi:tape measure domain-containing protein